MRENESLMVMMPEKHACVTTTPMKKHMIHVIVMMRGKLAGKGKQCRRGQGTREKEAATSLRTAMTFSAISWGVCVVIAMRTFLEAKSIIDHAILVKRFCLWERRQQTYAVVPVGMWR